MEYLFIIPFGVMVCCLAVLCVWGTYKFITEWSKDI